MILTDNEMRYLRRVIEEQAGLDEELVQRCGRLIHGDAFDEAVRSAFVLLEERLRKAAGVEGMTGTQLANHVFNPNNGVLAKHLGRSQAEREGLRELYSGAFKLFRNPSAHGVVGYSAAEGKDIVSLVDLLLKLVKRAEDLPLFEMFPDNLEEVLSKFEGVIGSGATSRLRVFLGKSIMEIGLTPDASAKQWIPFRRYCLYKPVHWEEPRSHAIAVFYLLATGKNFGFSFPTAGYYRDAVGFNVERLIKELTDLGFYLTGKNQEPQFGLKTRNDQAFFDALFDLVARTADELEATLQSRTKGSI